jgi:hypothetical protein
VIAALLLAAVTLSAQPKLLRPDDARAVVRIEAAEEPRLSVSAGRLENLRRAADGAFEADYLPPEEPVPRVAILTAVAGGELGWLALPLYGEGDALVKTRKRARITVRIGDQVFGPVEADRSGDALVPVIVPPGVSEAYHGEQAIDLHVPRTQALQLAPGVAAGRADREQKVPLFVAVVTPSGGPRRGAVIELSASRGTISAPREVSEGLYQAELVVPPGLAGDVAVQASLADAPQFVSKAAVSFVAGPARSIALAAETSRVVAGGAPLRLRASARDAADNPSPEPLRFAASFGEVKAESAGEGEWALTLVLPPSFQGRTSLEVTAQAANASASAIVELQPATAATVAFAGPLPRVRADGQSPVRLPLEVRDAYGNPAQASPELSAAQGQAGFESSGGALYATYLPPLLHEPSATRVDARLGGSTATAQLLLLPESRRLAFSPKLGYLTNFDGFSAPFAGVEAAARTDRFGVGLELDYAQRLHDEPLASSAAVGGTSVGTGVNGSSRIGLLLFHLSAAWRVELEPRTTMWLSAGPSAAAYWVNAKVSGAPAQTGSALVPGAQAAVGVERRLGFAVPFVELRAGLLAQPDLPNVAGALRTFSFCGGARFEAL